MNIIVNGNEKQVKPGTTVQELLQQMQLADKPAAVEVNRAIIRKAEHGQRELQPGDAVEIVTLVGGG